MLLYIYYQIIFLNQETISKHSNHIKNAKYRLKKFIYKTHFTSKFLDFDIFNSATQCFKAFNQSSFKYFDYFFD